MSEEKEISWSGIGLFIALSLILIFTVHLAIQETGVQQECAWVFYDMQEQNIMKSELCPKGCLHIKVMQTNYDIRNTTLYFENEDRYMNATEGQHLRAYWCNGRIAMLCTDNECGATLEAKP